MKKLSLIVLATLMLSACKKNYTCQCSDGGVVSESYTIRDTQAQAKTRCESNEHCSGCVYIQEHHCEIK